MSSPLQYVLPINSDYTQVECEADAFAILLDDQLYPDVVYNTTLKEWQCCGANSNGDVSCNAPTTNEFFDAPAPAKLSTTATAGQTTSAKRTATRTRTPTGTKKPTTPSPSATASSSTLSTGAKAGIGVGAACGALLIIGLIAWLLLRMRKRRKDTSTAPTGQAPEMDTQAQPFRQDFKHQQGPAQPMWNPAVEADSAQRHEMAQPGVESFADNKKGPKIYPLSNEQAPLELPANQPWQRGPHELDT